MLHKMIDGLLVKRKMIEIACDVPSGGAQANARRIKENPPGTVTAIEELGSRGSVKNRPCTG
jgi:hypothetical protein